MSLYFTIVKIYYWLYIVGLRVFFLRGLTPIFVVQYSAKVLTQLIVVYVIKK